jgi:hypothetical protein
MEMKPTWDLTAARKPHIAAPKGNPLIRIAVEDTRARTHLRIRQETAFLSQVSVALLKACMRLVMMKDSMAHEVSPVHDLVNQRCHPAT